MVNVRLVALSTLVAAGALALSLNSMKKHAVHAPKVEPTAAASSLPAESGSAATPIPNPKEAEPAPSPAPQAKDYAVFPDGTAVPELPATAPKSCGFGAILVTFEGAQFAPRKARSKAEAYNLAKDLIASAEKDFAGTVKQGDPGSLADAGSIGRGILERPVEYRLFTLEKGQVHPEPVETPRGYWVLKRLR